MDTTQTERFVNHITSAQAGLYEYISSLLGDRDGARDVLQETNLVLWRKAAEFDESRGFAAWSSGIAYFQVLAWLRDRGRERRRFRDDLMELIAAEAAKRVYETDDRLDALRRCLAKLSPEHRDVVQGRYEEGDSVGDLARRMQKSPAAISMTLQRIRLALQTCITRDLAGAAR